MRIAVWRHYANELADQPYHRASRKQAAFLIEHQFAFKVAGGIKMYPAENSGDELPVGSADLVTVRTSYLPVLVGRTIVGRQALFITTKQIRA